MKPKIFSQFIVLILFLFDILFYNGVKAEFDDDSWMSPSSWSQNIDCCKCPESLVESFGGGNAQSDDTNPPKFTEDGVALLYMRRWLKQLFDRKNLILDDKLNIYKRSVTFTLSSSRLEKMEKLNDPRDLDEIITEIFATVTDDHGCSSQKETSFIALVVDIIIDLIQLTKINEVRFLLVATLVAICAWFLRRKYNISYITQAVVALLVFGYIHTYLECNRELEIKEMKEVLMLSEKPRLSKFMSYLNNFFSSSNSHDEHHHELLKKSTKLNLGICRPDHVALIYFNDMFMKYVELMVQQSIRSLGILQDNLKWPLNWIAGILFFGFIAFLLKLTFQYILGPGVSSHSWQRPTQNPNVPVLHQGTEHADRVSGENLKKLLNVLSSTMETSSLQKLPEASGVQDIQEAIECDPYNDTSTSSTPRKESTKTLNSSKKKNNNESPAKKNNPNLSDVTMEDLPEDT